MNAVIYTRVSSDEQVHGMSLDFQREDCVRYAKEKHLTVLRLFVEEGESAKFANRPRLVELLEFCRQHKRSLDAVIGWKLDRLSRNQMDYYFIKRTLFEYGIAIHSATEPTLADGASIEAKVFETFSALQAEIDNTMRRDRAIRGMAAKIESGIYPWQPPLGYLSAHNRRNGFKKTEPDRPDPERFPLIVRLFRTCFSERIRNTVELARQANAWGLRSQTEKRMYPQVIDRMLRNKFYAGILVNPWTGEEYAGRHQPAVSPDEFEVIQLIREGRKPYLLTPRRREHPDFPLRRTVLCGLCRGGVTGSWSRGNGGRYAYYHCPQKGCQRYGKGVPKLELERAFAQRLEDLTPTSKAIQVFQTTVGDLWQNRYAERQDAQAHQESSLKALETRWANLVGMKERDLLSDAEFLERKTLLKRQIMEAERRLTTACRPVTDIAGFLAHIGEHLANLPRWWRDEAVERKRRFQEFVFPTGIPYLRESGFGTTKMSLFYEIFSTADGSESRLVHLVGTHWNQISDFIDCQITHISDP